MSSKAWTVLELIQWTAGHFKAKGIEGGRREAEDLLCKVLDLDRLKLYLQFEYLPTPSELAMFRELVGRRARHEPIQYLLGRVNFNGIELKVDPRALIPRPESEALATLAADLLGSRLTGAAFADIGTGTGCLALSLIKSGAGKGTATDISEAALDLARENAQALSVADKLEFILGSGLEPLKGRADFDLVISNPPYIPLGERESLQSEVRDWEPASALFGGPEGLDVLEPLLAGAAAHLKAGGLLVMECGQGQPEKLKERGSGWAKIWTERDPFGITRYVLAEK